MFSKVAMRTLIKFRYFMETTTPNKTARLVSSEI
jgi:hypothetical protein